MKLTVLVDNTAAAPWAGEHGLALWLSTAAGEILFDTGAGGALLPNLRRAGIAPESFRAIVLSHGHGDHTGALGELLPLAPQAELWFGAGVDRVRFSHHPGRPVRELTMPEAARAALRAHPPARVHPVTVFTEILPGIHLTGPILRTSGEDCGGPFFLDREGAQPDRMDDEIALLTAEGTLIQGCCHAGILNTLAHCARCRPEIPVRTVVGGLHLVHASVERLERTAAALAALNPERLILLHCTGEGAVAFLRERLTCPVLTPPAGSVIAC